jgi:hypothetical protein
MPSATAAAMTEGVLDKQTEELAAARAISAFEDSRADFSSAALTCAPPPAMETMDIDECQGSSDVLGICPLGMHTPIAPTTFTWKELE